MLRKSSVLSYMDYLLNPIGAGSESEVFITTFGVLKLFRSFLKNEILQEKLEILKYFDKLDFSKKHPEIVVADELLFQDEDFKGYIMAYVSGTSFKDSCYHASLEKILYICEEIEKLLKILHSYDIYLQDLTEENAIVTKDKVYLIDNDSCYKGKRKRKKGIAIKYPCPYSKIISKESNLFTLRLITILALTGELNFIFGKYYLSFFKRKKLKKKLIALDIPKDLKEKLLQALSKKGFKKIDYMF